MLGYGMVSAFDNAILTDHSKILSAHIDAKLTVFEFG
jgi:hypothetical protein